MVLLLQQQEITNMKTYMSFPVLSSMPVIHPHNYNEEKAK